MDLKGSAKLPQEGAIAAVRPNWAMVGAAGLPRSHLGLWPPPVGGLNSGFLLPAVAASSSSNLGAGGGGDGAIAAVRPNWAMVGAAGLPRSHLGLWPPPVGGLNSGFLLPAVAASSSSNLGAGGGGDLIGFLLCVKRENKFTSDSICLPLLSLQTSLLDVQVYGSRAEQVSLKLGIFFTLRCVDKSFGHI
ncbi:hypothetical protein C4D60_Mb01t30500 [Musa balbisiana]|uniref:TCP domain-containing protein n=1 Tax=Musa balbisiana TaxID=52838 RepID=A0A4S8JRV7_MUSBA|nr:hypothetical protein C4D60_Mb01t30500 [Musa balbisiana]